MPVVRCESPAVKMRTLVCGVRASRRLLLPQRKLPGP